MYFVYILYSPKFVKSYIGISSNVEERLESHNSGKSNYTSKYKPWILIHSEVYDRRIEAREREKYLKSTAGRKWMKHNINWPRSSTG